jgi:CBS domain-containing protein
MIMKVRDVMTRKPLTVKQDSTLKDALTLLSKNNITGCPVVDGGRNLVGVVGQTDIIKLVDVYGKVNKSGEFLSFISSFAKNKSLNIKKLHNIKVKEFCNKNPVVIDHNDAVYDAARAMNRHDIERLPVLDGKKLVGIVTRTDLIRAFEKM